MRYTVLLFIAQFVVLPMALIAQWDASGRVPLSTISDRDRKFVPISLSSVSIDNNDCIITARTGRDSISNETMVLVRRFLPSGIVDSSFGDHGSAWQRIDLSDQASALTILDTNNAIVVGVIDTDNLKFLRITELGSRDFSYGENGVRTIGTSSGDFKWGMNGKGHDRYVWTRYKSDSDKFSSIYHLLADGSLASDSMKLTELFSFLVVEPNCYYTTTASINKRLRNGDIDSSFGTNGSAKIQTLSNYTTLRQMQSIDDTTLFISTWGDEAQLIPYGENRISVYDKRTGEILRNIVIPYSRDVEYFSFVHVSSDGAFVVGGGIWEFMPSGSKLAVRWFTSTDQRDYSAPSHGWYTRSPTFPEKNILMSGMGVLSNRDLIYAESTDTLCRLTRTPTSVVDEQLSLPSLYISPNPASNVITVRSSLSLIGDRYVLVSTAGEVVKSGTFRQNDLPIRDQIASGLYTLMIMGQGHDPLSVRVAILK